MVTICTTSLTFNNSTFCPHTVFMCFVWIWEQTAIISLYSINWLFFVTETECVYCAVRTGSLYIIQVMCFVWISEQTVIISLYNINWLVFITETECVYFAVRTGSLYIIQVMWFVWISAQTVIISLYNINWLLFITEMKCVYCVVRAGSLYIHVVLVNFCASARSFFGRPAAAAPTLYNFNSDKNWKYLGSGFNYQANRIVTF